ncbi:unnamed protein product, partial [Hapterophycus canaliculatus]
EDADDDASWLHLAAAPDDKALSLQTRAAAQDAADSTISRCVAIIKDVDSHLYRRGMAVLALGRTLRRELCKNSRSPTSTQEFRQECAGAGGVLDSVLDILGQCTAPPMYGVVGGGGEVLALSAGCGVADALAIRTNCCALISLLVSAVLATANTTIQNGAENVDVDAGLHKGIASSPEEDVSGNGGRAGSRGRGRGEPSLEPVVFNSGGGEDCGAFVPMSAKPNPDVVSVVRKKGWAARQHRQLQLPLVPPPAVEAATMNKTSRRLRVSGVGGRVKMQLQRSRPTAGTACSSDRAFTRSAFHQAVEPPSGSGQHKRGELSLADPAIGRGRIDDNGRSGAAVEETPTPLDVRKSRHHQHHHRGRVPYGFSSPPRLSRVKGRGLPELASSSSDPSFPSPGPHGSKDESGVGTLGLSNPRNESQSKTVKVNKGVWHTVSVSPRKGRREKAAIDQSPPVITLVAGETSERFKAQPPVRQAVIFGSDLVPEVEFKTFWDRDNDGVASDAKLGYQVPRLWFPHAKPGQARVDEWAPTSAGVSMPEPRPRASGGADLPIGSDAVVQEYQQMQAFRAYSALAHVRPSPADPFHGVDANVALVSALGKHPEEVDAAIAEEWSPRRGRKPTQSRAAAAAAADGKQFQDRRFRRVDDAGQLSSPSTQAQLQPARSARGERYPSRGSNWSTSPGSGVREHTDGGNEHSFASPPPKGKASISWSPPRRDRGKKRRRPVRGRKGERGGGEKATTFSRPDHNRDIELYSFPASGDDGSGRESFVNPFDATSRWRAASSPDAPTSYGAAASMAKPSGNLGGSFMQPESSYRTYRAKHSRLLRARSSERSAARTRRVRLQESLDWLPRSRSADGDGKGRGYRSGFSGMNSPLLRGEAFGLLQSRATGKIALGFQLPRDLSSVSGRERTKAAVAESALRSAHDLLPEMMPLESAGRRRQKAAHRHRGWLPVHHDGSLTDGEETDLEDLSHARCFSSQAAGRGQTPDGDSCSDGAVLDSYSASAAGRSWNREDFSVTRHFLRVGMRWPSPLRRGAGRAPLDSHRRCSGSLGRSRGTSRRRRLGPERPSGRNTHGVGGYSWSPPRTRMRPESCNIFSDAIPGDMNTITAAFYRDGSGEDEHEKESYDEAEKGLARSRYGAHQHHDPRQQPSPLLLPLDPYRDSRTVVRAGTLVSLRDAAAAERASRRAAFCIRRASEERVAAERRATDENALLPFSGSRHRGQRRRRRRQTRGADGKNLGDLRSSGFKASTVFLDDEEADEQWRDSTGQLLPSVENMGRELEAIRMADAAMREEQLAQV